MRCLVTGSHGVIGTRLWWELERLGHQVVAYDKEIVDADVLDAKTLHWAMQHIDMVYHLAGTPSESYCTSEPRWTAEVHVIGTLNVLEAARKNGVKRVVLASSCAASEPIRHYGLQKRCAEMLCQAYNEMHGRDNIILRLYNVYGCGGNTLISRLCEAIRNNYPPTIYGDGSQTRDFVHIGDVVNAFVMAATCKPCNQPIDIGTGVETSVLDAWKTLARLTKTTLEPQFAQSDGKSAVRSCANLWAAREVLGWTPRRDLEAGLREVLG